MESLVPLGIAAAAKVVIAALKKALGYGSSEISESELTQVARVTLVGSGNVVRVDGPSRSDTSFDHEGFLRALVTRCFELVLQQPGLSLVFTVGVNGERIIRIDNPATFTIPTEEELTQRLQPRINERRPVSDATGQTATMHSETYEPARRPVLRTAQDYADYARHLVELPDHD